MARSAGRAGEAFVRLRRGAGGRTGLGLPCGGCGVGAVASWNDPHLARQNHHASSASTRKKVKDPWANSTQATQTATHNELFLDFVDCGNRNKLYQTTVEPRAVPIFKFVSSRRSLPAAREVRAVVVPCCVCNRLLGVRSRKTRSHGGSSKCLSRLGTAGRRSGKSARKVPLPPPPVRSLCTEAGCCGGAHVPQKQHGRSRVST